MDIKEYILSAIEDVGIALKEGNESLEKYGATIKKDGSIDLKISVSASHCLNSDGKIEIPLVKSGITWNKTKSNYIEIHIPIQIAKPHHRGVNYGSRP